MYNGTNTLLLPQFALILSLAAQPRDGKDANPN
jgi:hypothetical protein